MKLSINISALLILVLTMTEGRFIHPPDFYNLDIGNFQFFKKPGHPTWYGVRQLQPKLSLTEQAKAMFTYFGRVLLGHPLQQNTYNIPFDPERGLRLRQAYQRQFGYRGENLIALIGNGPSPRELRHYGVIGRDFGRL
uniref:uncharacterized protein LOC129758799 n=1 Tax=Uranotaenia lowii TaxID=190385 RepID=UPI0024787EC1|nr:uncharacterized protein LOC129758799 [Uranotaenia lowii]